MCSTSTSFLDTLYHSLVEMTTHKCPAIGRPYVRVVMLNSNSQLLQPYSTCNGVELLFEPKTTMEHSFQLLRTILTNSKIELHAHHQVQSNLDLRTQLVKNGCTYCKKYLNRGMDSHRLPCEVVQLVNGLPKKFQKFNKPLKLHVKRFNWSMTFPIKSQNFLKT
jgi:hypothetical protein